MPKGGKGKVQEIDSDSGSDVGDVSNIQSKLEALNMAGNQDFVAALTEAQKNKLEALKKLDGERVELYKEFDKELNALKAKYEKLYAPVYEKRAEALTSSEEADASKAGTPGIPNFWLNAMKQHRQMADMIEPQDEPVLSYLENISVKYLSEDDMRSFQLLFKFSENPYFEPTTLVKTYNVEADGTSGDVLASTESTTLKWHEGKNVTKRTITRKQKNRRTKAVRKITETVECPSFFNFFSGRELPSEEQLEEMDEEAVQELEIVVEADYGAGCILKDKIVPDAVNWFTGDAEESDDSDFDDDDMGDEDDEDSDDDDDEPITRGDRKSVV